MSQQERKAKIDTTHALPVTKQCKVLSISRSSAYYKAQTPSDEELNLMKQLDELHLRYPFYGARRLRDAILDEHGLIIMDFPYFTRHFLASKNNLLQT